jgi:PAS domain S-box-containing protein
MTAAPTDLLTRRLAQVDSLSRLARHLAEAEDGDRAIQAAAVEGLRLFEAERAAVFIFDRPRGSVECRFSLGLSSAYLQVAVSRIREYPPAALAVEEGEPFFVADLGADPDYPLRAEAAREGVVGMAVLPLRFAGEAIGSIALYHDQPRDYPPEERGIASAFAEIAALAIGKSRLLDQVTRIKREWQSAFDGTGSGLALVEATGHISRGNRFLADLAGVPVTSLPGLSIRTLFPAWPRPSEDPLLQALSTNLRVSHPLEGRDGRHLVVSATPRPMGGLVVAVEDFTALVQLEERFTRLVQTAEDAIVIADPEGRLVFANRTACELFDRTSAELQGQSLDSLLPPDSSEPAPSAMPGSQVRPPARYTATVAHVDGTRYAAVARAPLEERGTRTGTVAVVRDVTRERHASEALRRSESRFRALFAAAPLAIFTVTEDHRFQSVNHAAVVLAELGRRDRGRRVGDFIQPDELFQVEAHLAASFRGETRSFTFHVSRLDGTSRVADAVAVAYGQESGDRAVLLIARDVTDEVRLRERVTHSEKLAALGQLVSGVAHELNNPLAGIAALAQALSLDPTAGADAAGVADSIRREAVRAARIVTELLTFARQRPLRRAPIDLNQVVHAALAGTPRASEGGAHWVLELDESLPQLLGDAEQLQQVLANLLLNAAQSMTARGGGHGTIRTWASDRIIGCEVCDDGTGIAPDVLPRIFEPFFTTKDVGAGTGLGLSISHGIIRAHGGDIMVKNLAAGGAAFWFELPRAGAPAMKVTNG